MVVLMAESLRDLAKTHNGTEYLSPGAGHQLPNFLWITLQPLNKTGQQTTLKNSGLKTIGSLLSIG